MYHRPYSRKSILAVASIVAGILWMSGQTVSNSASNADAAPPYNSATASTTSGSWTYRLGGLSGFKVVITTTDGGFMTAGYTHQNLDTGASDLMLLRLDSAGQKIWATALRYASGIPEDVWVGHNLVATSDGAYILAASVVYNRMDGNVPEIVKFDDAGNLLWSKSYLGLDINHQPSIINTTAPTDDGGAILVSEVALTSTDTIHTALIRIDASGDPVWYKTIGGPTVDHIPYSLRRTSDGNYVGAGWINPRLGGATAGWAFMIDGSGALLWSTRVADPLLVNSEYPAWDVAETSDGNYLLTGIALTYSPETKGYVAKLDSTGALVWQKIYSNANEIIEPKSIAPTSDGGAVLAGAWGNIAGFAARITDAGDVVWSKRYYTGTDHISIVPAPGGYIIGGQWDTMVGPSIQVDALLTHIDGNGIVAATCSLASDLPLSVSPYTDIAPTDNSSVVASTLLTSTSSPFVFSLYPTITSYCPILCYLPLILNGSN